VHKPMYQPQEVRSRLMVKLAQNWSKVKHASIVPRENGYIGCAHSGTYSKELVCGVELRHGTVSWIVLLIVLC